jgi:hypothetical protein
MKSLWHQERHLILSLSKDARCRADAHAVHPIAQGHAILPACQRAPIRGRVGAHVSMGGDMGGSIAGRFIGVVLLAATVGLASCQAFLTGPPEQPAAVASDATPEPGEGDAPAGDE